VRYTLGHTLASILTLESVYARSHGHKDEDSELNAPFAPLSRHLFYSLRVLYAHQGLRIFTTGLHVAAIYQALKVVLRNLLAATILYPVGSQPIADIVATVLLAEAHMYFTHTTISSSKSSLGGRLWTHDRERWIKLSLPCLAQASALALLNWVSRSLPDLSGSSNIDASQMLSAIAVLRAFVALIIRSFVLAPVTAWLTLVEASCLDSRQETLIYEQAKRKFASVGAVFARHEQRSFGELWKGVSLHLCLWLLELHVKKCAIQMALEALVFWIVRLVS
jgi:hypothetical protein